VCIKKIQKQKKKIFFEKIEHYKVLFQSTLSNMTSTQSTTKMSEPKIFGPQWWKEGRKWGSRSTPSRLNQDMSESEPLEFEGLPRRSDCFSPEPTWQNTFHDLHDLMTGSTEQNRDEVTFEQVGSLLRALQPPRPTPPPPVVYKEPSFSEYELLRQKDLEDDKAALVILRETQHENSNTLKTLVAKQDELIASLQKKEDEWTAEQERQKKVYRPRYLAAVAPAQKPVFRENKQLDDLQMELTKIRVAMGDYKVKRSKLLHRIEDGEAFMAQAAKNLEILREYRKFEHTLVGDYI
jgi:hypothetical protein